MRIQEIGKRTEDEGMDCQDNYNRFGQIARLCPGCGEVMVMGCTFHGVTWTCVDCDIVEEVRR